MQNSQNNDRLGYLTVTEINSKSREMLEDVWSDVPICGEISNLKKYSSGHWYFSIRDENAQISAVMFKFQNYKVNFNPQQGDKILARGKITLYEANGNYQIVLHSMLKDDGVGKLKLEYENFKKELQDLGILTRKRKPLPEVVKTVGIVTSSNGAALYDILRVLKRRDPFINVIIYPASVQGERAEAEISNMIKIANSRAECDVLIVGRGGGSFEDLYAFSKREVIRAIFASKIPVISAVGHEVDESISDLVADFKAATPTAAAEMISRDKSYLIKDLTRNKERIYQAIDHTFNQKKLQFNYLKDSIKYNNINSLKQSFSQLANRCNFAFKQQINAKNNELSHIIRHFNLLNPKIVISNKQQYFNKELQRLQTLFNYNIQKHQSTFEQNKRLLLAVNLQKQIKNKEIHLQNISYQIVQMNKRQLEKSQHQFALTLQKIEQLSPLGVLSRGYSVTKKNGKVIKKADELQVGDEISTTLKNSQILSKIINII